VGALAQAPSVRTDPVIAHDPSIHEIEARLAEAADSGRTLEVILVFRGRVRRASRSGRWRMRLTAGGVATFSADAAVAVTPIGRHGR